MVSAGNVKGPLDGDAFRASNRDMAARSRYIHVRRRPCGGDRSDMENRMPLLPDVSLWLDPTSQPDQMNAFPKKC